MASLPYTVFYDYFLMSLIGRWLLAAHVGPLNGKMILLHMFTVSLSQFTSCLLNTPACISLCEELDILFILVGNFRNLSKYHCLGLVYFSLRC